VIADVTTENFHASATINDWAWYTLSGTTETWTETNPDPGDTWTTL